MSVGQLTFALFIMAVTLLPGSSSAAELVPGASKLLVGDAAGVSRRLSRRHREGAPERGTVQGDRRVGRSARQPRRLRLGVGAARRCFGARRAGAQRPSGRSDANGGDGLRERSRQGEHRADARPRRSTIGWPGSRSTTPTPRPATTSRRRCATSAAPAWTRTRRRARAIKALREELVTLGQQFDDNIAGDVRTLELDPKDLDGLPDDFKRAHPPGANGKVDADDQQHRLPAVHDLRDQRDGPRRVLEAVPAARRTRRTVRCSNACSKRASELAGALGFADLGRLHHRRQDDRHAAERRRLHRPHRRRVRSPDEARLRQRAGPASEGRARARASSTPGTARYYQEKVKAEQYNFDSQSVRPYFEYSTREAGRARHHRPDVRHHLPAGARRRGLAPGRRGLRRARGRRRARPDLPRHVPARQQVQALRAVHARPTARAAACCRRACWSAISRSRAPSRR